MKIVKIFVLIALFVGGQAWSQTYQATIDQFVSDNTLVVDLLFETTSGIPDRLGNATLALHYNQEALDFLGKDDRYDGLWDADYSPSYLQIHPEDRSPTAIVHIVRTENGQGVAIPSAPTRVIRLLFEITDRDAISEIQWDVSHATSVYDWQGNYIRYKFTWIQPGNFPVPVELTGFQAEQASTGITLTWSTASETNCLGFDLLRSTHPQDGFIQLNANLILGAGDSQIDRWYSFTDSQIENGKTYYYKLRQIDYNGNTSVYNAVEIEATAPEQLVLFRNYPNPFNSQTRLTFQLKNSNRVELAIYSLKGEKIRTILSGMVGAGTYSKIWNGEDDAGQAVASGTYFYRLKCGAKTLTRKMLYLR